MNFNNMMQQAQKMQKKLQEAQEELSALNIVGSAGDDAVSVTLNGQGKFKKITLSGKALNPSNPDSVDKDTIEMLEDLIAQAMADATKKANDEAEAKMKNITGGIKIPGLF